MDNNKKLKTNHMGKKKSALKDQVEKKLLYVKN